MFRFYDHTKIWALAKLLLFHTLIQEAEHPTMKPASLKKDLSIIHIKHYTHDMAQGLFYPKGQIR